MEVRFLKNHEHQGATWSAGAIGNINADAAKQWAKEGILEIVDTTAATKAPAEVMEEETTAEPIAATKPTPQKPKRKKTSLRKRAKE